MLQKKYFLFKNLWWAHSLWERRAWDQVDPNHPGTNWYILQTWINFMGAGEVVVPGSLNCNYLVSNELSVKWTKKKKNPSKPRARLPLQTCVIFFSIHIWVQGGCSLRRNEKVPLSIGFWFGLATGSTRREGEGGNSTPPARVPREGRPSAEGSAQVG